MLFFKIILKMEETVLILFVILLVVILIGLIIYSFITGIKYIIDSINYLKNERRAQELNDLAIAEMKNKLEIYDNIENFSIKDLANKSNKKAISNMREDLNIFF